MAALIRRLLADSSLTYHRKLARLISWEKKHRRLVACPCPTDERLAKGMLTLLLEDALGHFEDTTNRPL